MSATATPSNVPGNPGLAQAPQGKPHNPFIGRNGEDLGPGPEFLPSKCDSSDKPNPFGPLPGEPHGPGPVVNTTHHNHKAPPQLW